VSIKEIFLMILEHSNTFYHSCMNVCLICIMEPMCVYFKLDFYILIVIEVGNLKTYIDIIYDYVRNSVC
jgi:hypothetical protein